MAAATNPINQMMNQYLESDRLFDESQLSMFSGSSIGHNGFMGSLNVVFLTSQQSINFQAPACIAAQLINMVAKEAIKLGSEGQGFQQNPVWVYAPVQLTITTKHLSIGDLKFIESPNYGYVSCQKLTLKKFQEEEPESFEIVRSWLMNDDVEIVNL